MAFKSYIKIPRELFRSEEWGASRKFSRFEAMIDLLESAAYADGFVVYCMTRDVVLKRGQLLTSQRDLAERWGWSPATVNRYLQTLRNTRRNSIRIKIKTTIETGKTLITICDYDEWDFEIKGDETPCETASETLGETASETHIELSISNNTGNKDITHTQVFTEKGVVGGNSAALDLLDWITENVPTIASMLEPITEQQAIWMLKKYDIEDIRRIITTMHSKEAYKGSNHAYAVFTGFAGLDYIIKRKRADAQSKERLFTYTERCNMLPTNGGQYSERDFEPIKTDSGLRWKLKKSTL